MLIRYSFSKYLPLINLEIHSILSFVKALLLLAYFTKKKKKKGELSVKEEVRPVAAKIPHVLSSCRLPRGWDQTPYTGICFGLRTNWVLRSPSSWRAWKYQKTAGIAYGEPVCSQVWEYPAAQPQGSDMEKKMKEILRTWELCISYEQRIFRPSLVHITIVLTSFIPAHSVPGPSEQEP